MSRISGSLPSGNLAKPAKRKRREEGRRKRKKKEEEVDPKEVLYTRLVSSFENETRSENEGRKILVRKNERTHALGRERDNESRENEV